MQQIIQVDTYKQELYLIEDDKIIKTIKNIAIGKNGTTKNKREGDMCTPLGRHSLGLAFGTHNLNISYPYFTINPNLYYIDDSKSKYYNQLVDISKVSKDWQSAEHLIDYSAQYEYALIIEYNKECLPYQGSAIFLHVATNSFTAGCIAVAKEEMLYILNWLNQDFNPFIEIN